MKNRFPLLVIIILALTGIKAEAASATENMKQDSFKPVVHSSEEIQMQKIAFYSQELQLTPEEAQKFWPLYNEYWEVCRKARTRTVMALKALSEATRENSTATDAEIEKLTKEYFSSYEAEADLPIQYFAEFKKILPIKKAARIFNTEEKFRRMLIKQFRNTPPPPKR